MLLIIFLLGLCFGSFVNALVWRLHEQSKPKKKRTAKNHNLSIVSGRSMCIDCKHPLATKDLVPVLSWLSLGGKCRYCKKPISWQYPVVELLLALLFTEAFIYWLPDVGSSATSQIIGFVLFLVALIIGTALAVYDFKWMMLPDRLVRVLVVIGLLFAVVSLCNGSQLPKEALNLVSSVLISGGLFYLLFQLSKGKWIGGGDVKLGLVLGLFLLTPTNAFMMLFIASWLGTLYALMLVIIGKYKKGIKVPFGPFLLLATYIVVIFGSSLIGIYKDLFLL